jgi:hypothetical protein
VAGADQANSIAGVVDRIEKVIQLPARQTKDRIHTVRGYGFEQRYCARYPRHPPAFLLSLITDAYRMRKQIKLCDTEYRAIPTTDTF